MDSMQQEMQHEENGSVRKDLVNVEQESVKEVFQQRPYKVPKEEAWEHSSPRFKWNIGEVRKW